jgi:non-ribosomal peptide synthetase component F
LFRVADEAFYAAASDPREHPLAGLIGLPVDNMQLYVLDDRSHLLPIGAVGHLFAGGTGLSVGYVDRPALTASRFLPNPFVGEESDPGSRLFKTGTRAHHLPDGRLCLVTSPDPEPKTRDTAEPEALAVDDDLLERSDLAAMLEELESMTDEEAEHELSHAQHR